jgi:O-6-methylguanine DNA methyltransferase
MTVNDRPHPTPPSVAHVDDGPPELRELGVRAPVELATNVLVELGLADRYATIGSPIGPLVVAWNGLGVSAVEAAPDEATFEAAHLSRTGRAVHRAEALPERLAGAIERRLAGDRRVPIALDLRGRTGFERDVWLKALEIPRGEVRPYGWIAAEIGRPKAVRAVGTALGHNPVPLIVPCHRVVRSDGFIGQYSLGGPDNKRAILAAEGLDPDALESQARAGIRYVGSDTTHIVCLPTCSAAKRIGPAHRIPFHSLGEAGSAGYRACRRCRPASAAGMVAA